MGQCVINQARVPRVRGGGAEDPTTSARRGAALGELPLVRAERDLGRGARRLCGLERGDDRAVATTARMSSRWRLPRLCTLTAIVGRARPGCAGRLPSRRLPSRRAPVVGKRGRMQTADVFRLFPWSCAPVAGAVHAASVVRRRAFSSSISLLFGGCVGACTYVVGQEARDYAARAQKNPQLAALSLAASRRRFHARRNATGHQSSRDVWRLKCQIVVRPSLSA